MNEGIIQNLEILVQYYKQDGDQWRVKAYSTAIFSIKKLGFEITDIKQIKNVKGIGKGIQSKIKEYLDYGQINKVEELKGKIRKKVDNTKDTILNLFQGVWGVGPAKANQLYDKGMRNLKDLQKNQQLLNANQLVGLKHYEDLLKPIPREYINIFEIMLRAVIIKEFGPNTFRMQIAGSYRRGKKQSGDIDCLFTSKVFTLKDLVNVLVKWDIVTDILSMRGEKFMGVVHCPSGKWYHFRMDIEFLPEDEWGSGLLYFTGSKEFNTMMRNDAKKMGYTLNQHGLFNKNGDRIRVYTEKEIMSFLGMEYIPPQLR
jgi:DNA polymerase/3'-5' exonuclease PolX